MFTQNWKILVTLNEESNINYSLPLMDVMWILCVIRQNRLRSFQRRPDFIDLLYAWGISLYMSFSHLPRLLYAPQTIFSSLASIFDNSVSKCHLGLIEITHPCYSCEAETCPPDKMSDETSFPHWCGKVVLPSALEWMQMIAAFFNLKHCNIG